MLDIKPVKAYLSQFKRVQSYIVWTDKAGEYIHDFAYKSSDTTQANWFEQWKKDNNITTNVEALVFFEEKSCSGISSHIETHNIQQFIDAVQNECDRDMFYCTAEEYNAARIKFGFED